MIHLPRFKKIVEMSTYFTFRSLIVIRSHRLNLKISLTHNMCLFRLSIGGRGRKTSRELKWHHLTG